MTEELLEIPEPGELRDAVEKNDLAEVKDVLRRGADINEQDDIERNMLILAATKGFTEIALFLIEEGLDVNKHSRSGHSALTGAAFGGHVETVNLLLKKDANINAVGHAGRTPLMYSVTTNKPAVMRLLVECGADLTIRDNDGDTACDLMVKNNRFEMIAALDDFEKACATYTAFMEQQSVRQSHETSVRNQLLAASHKPDYVIKRRVAQP